MLSNDGNSGVFSFLVGMIILVMVSVGLSLLVDSRFRFSGNRNDIERQIRQQASEIIDLTGHLEAREEHYNRISSRRVPAAKQYDELKAIIDAAAARITDLETRRDELVGGVEEVEQAFADYRTRYRKMEWAAAAGETMPVLKIRGGRVYRAVVIKRITEVGMEIRHADGIARINAPDLDAPWHERFQWSDEERRAKLDAERRLASSFVNVARGQDASQKTRTAKSRDRAAAADLVKARRNDVTRCRARVSALRSELQSAREQSSYRGQTSVPGSLETWQARVNRLSGELTRATAQLNMAKKSLAEVAPKDPLLRQKHEEVEFE